jgi:glutamate--cysteine ligase
VASSFVAGRKHPLEPLGHDSFHLPHATSLRMGRLGYQSDAQAALNVSYNSLEGYAASLHGALTTPHPPYERMGVRGPGGEYIQLATSLLQIENEFYGTIRPKRTIRSGERPLHALRQRGVEYVEVRCMDLDPFEPVGIGEATLKFLDVFLLHCLCSASPPDTPQEMAEMARNQHRTASQGREGGLTLERAGHGVKLEDWGLQILQECAQIAEMLDRGLDRRGTGSGHVQACEQALARLKDLSTAPSARVLQHIQTHHGGSFLGFGLAQSTAARQTALQRPWSVEQAAAMQATARLSLDEQRQREAADTVGFEAYREHYLAPDQLMP